jgi:hypothetical protein
VAALGGGSGRRGGGRRLLGHPEVPLKDEILTLRVTHDAFAIPPELWVVRRQEHEAGQRSFAKSLDKDAVAELRLDLPVRGDRSEIDNADVAARRLRGCLGRSLGHRHVVVLLSV